MSALPTISSINPTSTPSVDAIQYAQAFLTELRFLASAPTDKWQCSIVTRNYNAVLGVLAPDTEESNHRISLSDVAAYAAEYPAFAQILGGVLVVSGLVQAERKAQSDKAVAITALVSANKLKDTDATKVSKVAEANVLLTTTNAALTIARTALGAV